jgi:membrane associated rhomboid family serine protease
MIPIRDENPTRIRPHVTWALAAAMTGVFAGQLALGPEGAPLVARYGAVPAELLARTGGPVPAWLWVTVVTSLFLHGGFVHLGGNLLFLGIFANNVEEAMGHGRFLVFFLLCGALATAAHVLANPDSRIPVIGASGAISGVLGAYAMLFPRARVLTLVPLGFFFPMVYIPAVAVLGVWFAFQVLSGLLAGSQSTGVAWFAHIGGFAAGILLVVPFKRRGVRLFARPGAIRGDPGGRK